MIEPSSVEQGEWSDMTRDYVYDQQYKLDRAVEALEEIIPCAGCWTGITVNGPKPASRLRRFVSIVRRILEDKSND